MNSFQNNGFEFLDFISLPEKKLSFFLPELAGSFAVLKCEDKFLLAFNVWRRQWELPAGKREGDESPKECALRELHEETGQQLSDLEFKGLLKVRNKTSGAIKWNPVYFASIKQLQPFKENTETSSIRLWDLSEEIGVLDEVDIKILDFL